MQQSSFYNTFLTFLSDIYDAERQMVEALPLMIQKSSDEELKKGLKNHLKETEEQVDRLEKSFSLLEESPKKHNCKGMAALIAEANEILEIPNLSPALRDCFIIISAQKVEHYEIASYGSLLSLLKHMQSACPEKPELEDIYNLLSVTLKEEGNADKALTAAAEGKLFVQGVNDAIEEELKVSH